MVAVDKRVSLLMNIYRIKAKKRPPEGGLYTIDYLIINFRERVFDAV